MLLPPTGASTEEDKRAGNKQPNDAKYSQMPRDTALLTPNSTEGTGNNGGKVDVDELSCMLHLSMPESYPDLRHDGRLNLLDLPLPGEDELMELLDTTPSDCQSSIGEFNFDFTASNIKPLPQSPITAPSLPNECQIRDRPDTTSPPDYNTLFDFEEATENPPPAFNSKDKSPTSKNATVHVDFSAANLYGLPESISRGSKKSQSNETIKIVEGLRRVLCDSPVSVADDGPLDWTRKFPETDTALSWYCDACFDDCCPIADFLTKAAVEKVIKQSREPDPTRLVSVFAEAIVAVGYHTACLRSRESPTREEESRAQKRLAAVLRLYKEIQNFPSTLMKFQVTLVMAVIAYVCEENSIWEKITAAVCCARDLRLIHAARGQQPSMSEHDQEQAQRGVWFLYSLETDYAIHHGMLPILDLGWGIQFPSFERGDDMVAVSYTFSELLHSVLKFQYSPRALNKSASTYDRRDRLQASCHVLNEWIGGLPAPLNEANNAKVLQSIKNDRQLRKAFRVFCMYHRAVFFIHCPWISPIATDDADSSGVAEQTRERCVERCVESAFTVIKLANSGTFWEEGLERDIGSSSMKWGHMGQLLLVSLCLIVHHLINGEKENRKTAMSYLAICGGLFGRLSLDSDEASLMDHYLELIQVVRAK
ncbi:hypothetical protein CORC01_00827 [Colletotrichum orchidophilum]|uniref:Transcription factor domain-containing protein n=1 Tax=Colletotrichum orchidophilum TaxID=1209926 RepID=A0A1G4BRN1_9PEZI|nr:uncharacterized protein CORC01_00827 [Colletotrichum orchidophilum]OHF03965.1 hypothetical protein CORC01_00827 [Colletotrichum orchidophilum]